MEDKKQEKMENLPIGHIEIWDTGEIWEWNGDGFVKNHDFSVVVNFILDKDRYIKVYSKFIYEIARLINENKSVKKKKEKL